MNSAAASIRFSIAALALTTLAASSGTARELRIDLADVGVDGRLTIAGLNGDTQVVGTTESFIVIGSDDFDDEDSRPAPEGMRSLLSNGSNETGIGFGIKREGKNVILTPDRPHQSADYELRIPMQMSLKLAGVLRGDVEVRKIAGEIEVVVTEGDVSIEDVAGPVVVQAVNGDVNIRFEKYPKGSPSSVNSVNGSVSVTLPADAAAELELMTINGDIYTDMPIEVTDRQISSWGGPRTVKGTLNGGGARLKINSINDDIILRSPAAGRKSGVE
jgi:hypothetical protein